MPTKRTMPSVPEIRAALADQTEAEVKKSCMDWLFLHNYRPIRVQTGVHIVSRGNVKYRIQCAENGTADCLVVLRPNGYSLWLEWKRTTGGVQSEDQRKFAEWCAEIGAGYRLIYSLDQLIAAMREEVLNARVRRPEPGAAGVCGR